MTTKLIKFVGRCLKQASINSCANAKIIFQLHGITSTVDAGAKLGKPTIGLVGNQSKSVFFKLLWKFGFLCSVKYSVSFALGFVWHISLY